MFPSPVEDLQAIAKEEDAVCYEDGGASLHRRSKKMVFNMSLLVISFTVLGLGLPSSLTSIDIRTHEAGVDCAPWSQPPRP